MAQRLQCGAFMTINVLPRGMTVEQLSEHSRDAVVAFLGLRSDERSLASWFTEHYGRSCLRASARTLRDRTSRDIEDLERAKGHVHELVKRLASGEPFAQLLPEVMHVEPVTDVGGARGCAAVAMHGIPLEARVVSLLVADYLTRPERFGDMANRVASRRVQSSHPTAPEVPRARKRAGGD